MTGHENVLPSLPRQFNWNRQNILYLQHDSELLALDTSVYYAFEANARQVRGTEQSNVSVCWSLDSRVDFYYITWRWGELFLPMPKRSNWLLYPVVLTFISQDPESEEGSTETDVPKVRNSYFTNKSYLLLAAVIDNILFCDSVISVQKWAGSNLKRCNIEGIAHQNISMDPAGQQTHTHIHYLSLSKWTRGWRGHSQMPPLHTPLTSSHSSAASTKTTSSLSPSHAERLWLALLFVELQLSHVCAFLGVAWFALVWV